MSTPFFHHFQNPSHSLPLRCQKKLAHAFVTCRLRTHFSLGFLERFCRGSTISRMLQLGYWWECTNMTSNLHCLHWLPVSTTIEYKISLLSHQFIYRNAPTYFKELLNPQSTTCLHHSTLSNLLHTPKTKLRPSALPLHIYGMPFLTLWGRQSPLDYFKNIS